jgi:hypothetical protein
LDHFREAPLAFNPIRADERDNRLTLPQPLIKDLLPLRPCSNPGLLFVVDEIGLVALLLQPSSHSVSASLIFATVANEDGGHGLLLGPRHSARTNIIITKPDQRLV